MNQRFEKLLSRTKAPLSAALVLLLLVLQTLAVSQALHSDLHEDATHEDHECVVTVLAKGQIDVSEPVLALPLAPTLTDERVVCAPPVLVSPILSLHSSRGPPALA